jgi:hypothetical protein
MNRIWSSLLAVVLVGSLAMNFIGPEKEMKHIWDVKTFFAVFGFFGYIVIVYAAKGLGKMIQRPESYYEPHLAPAEAGEAAASAKPSPADQGGSTHGTP